VLDPEDSAIWLPYCQVVEEFDSSDWSASFREDRAGGTLADHN
jgi:hypothetical protein